MKSRFFALRLISGIFKLLGVLTLIAMVGVIIYVLLNAAEFPQIPDKLPVVGVAAVVGILGLILLWAIGQFIDLMMAIEINTRATTKMLQRTGRLMDERL